MLTWTYSLCFLYLSFTSHLHLLPSAPYQKDSLAETQYIQSLGLPWKPQQRWGCEKVLSSWYWVGNIKFCFACLGYDLPGYLFEYSSPVGRGEDQQEPKADEDDASQLHVTEHHTVHHDVIRWQENPFQNNYQLTHPYIYVSTCRCRHSCYQSEGDKVFISDDDAEVGKQIGNWTQNE